MTKQQKIIIAILSTIALVVLAGLGCAAAFLVTRTPASEPASTPGAMAQQPSPTPPLTPSSTPTPPAMATPTQTPLPTPTSTRVVTVTVLPTPTPTRANCANDVSNFEASGLITSEQVRQYLHQAIPVTHLDNCRGIEYVHKHAAVRATPISGNIIPVYRQIYVYAVDPDKQGVEDLLVTLTHEIGHNVHYNIRRDNFELDVRWAELHRQSHDTFAREGLGFVSDYARTNKFEDFAETYKAYILAPEFLKLLSPDKYEFMRQEIFKGQEYLR